MISAAAPVAQGASRALVRRRPARTPTPRPQSIMVTSGDERAVGPTGVGRITVADSVVAKLAARAALEVDDVGAAAPRLLGHEMSGGGLGKLGVKRSELGALPSCEAEVDGQLAFIHLSMSVRYPAPVRRVAAEVREQLIKRVGAMTGLQVVEVEITVPALLAQAPSPPRVC